MTTAPPSTAQIQAQVEHLLKRETRPGVIGLRSRTHGSWPPELAIDGRTFRLEWCESPLAVRQLLVDDPASSEGIVILTPLADDALGTDVVSRFARGRLLAIDSCEMLCAAFQARHVDARLRSKEWIADELLERLPPGGYPPVAGGILDADTAWRHLLDRTVGISEARPDAERLLEWTIEDGAVKRFTSLTGKLKDEIAGWLSSVSGAAGSLIVSCVTSGQGLDAFPLGLVCGVIFSERWAETDLASAAVRLENFVGRRKVDSGAGRQWAEAALRLLGKTDDASFRRWLDRADRLMQQLHIFGYAAVSPVLPSGFEARLLEYAERLEQALGDPGVEALEMLETSTRAVLSHRMASQEAARARRADMAVRLVRWLRTKHEDVQSFDQAARSYARDGGYVDWARRAIMGGDENARVSAAYLALADKVRERRECDNQAFARLLRSWNAAPSVSETIVPVENVLSGLVASLAQRQIPVVLLVVDGLSFPVFRELSFRLSEFGWIELVPETSRGAPAAIAALPTITDVSRTSLLCGTLTRGNAQTEKATFASHPDLVAASARGKPPVLFHKSELGDAAGLSSQVREAIADPGRRIIGIVLNAVDDYLDGPDQLHVSWSFDDIRILRPLLREARDAGRVLIMISDHGHVLEDGTSFRAASEGDRWRCPSGDVFDDEIEIAGGRVLTPSGHHIAVMPWSERVRYASKKNGYHGGVSLQEVVIPLCILTTLGQVEGWKEAPPATPSWWQEGADGRQVPASAPPSPREPMPTTSDLPLFRQAAKPAAGSDWVAALLATSAYADQKALASRGAPSDHTVRTILVALQKRGGKLSKLALAQDAGVPLLRLPGLLSAVKRVINIDQSQILRIDDSADTVELNVELLRRQFGLGARK
jgi:hypothetical protein